MKRAWVCVAACWIAMSGCDKPCKVGYQRYGVKCVRSLVKDAGSDTNAIGAEDDEDKDSGRSPGAVDAGMSTSPEAETPRDAGTEPEPAIDAGPPCFLDRDGDGVGTGAPVACPSGPSPGATLVRATGDCDDNDAARSPTLTDICGDAIDNDCDSKVDDESNNACGGPCTIQLGHQPGGTCNNTLLGECERSGKYVCDGGSATKCDAATPAPSSERCGDNKDNDCDGSKDEEDATNATWWYQDCDGDGYAASTTGAQRGCAKPPTLGTCSWTAIVPDATTKSNWDCNDSLAAYRPGAEYGFPPGDLTNYDLNCDGERTASPVPPSGSYSPCSESVLEGVNIRGLKDCRYFDQQGCTAWKDSSGKLRREPSSTCPDPALRLGADLWDNGCALIERDAPVWKCR